MPQIDLKAIESLIKRHGDNGVSAAGGSTAKIPRGSYSGHVVHTQPQVDKWGRQVTRAVLAVTDDPHGDKQISVDVRGNTAKLLKTAAGAGKLVVFDVFVRRREDGREFSQVNRETIRLASNVSAGAATGLPAHVRAMTPPSDSDSVTDGRGLAPMNTPAGTTPAPPHLLTAQDIAAAAAPYTHGFACIGAKDAPRAVIPWAEVYSSMAGCTDQSVIGKPVFLSMHVFTDDFVAHVRSHQKPGSTAGYRGPAYSPVLVFDIDRKDDAGQPTPEVAHQDTLSLLVVLLELGVPHDRLRVSYSGSKGFHVEFPSMLAGAMPSENFLDAENAFCSMIAAEAGIEIDPSLYRTLQPLRAPNSRHEGTRLFKVSMTTEEFLDLSFADIRGLANRPRAFAPPCLMQDPVPALRELWMHAEQKAISTPHRGERDASSGGEDARIWQSTWQFLIGGAPDGERAVATFRAAANLSDFESVEDLIRALLDRATALCGLPPSEAAAHIDSALRRAEEARLFEQIQFPPQP
jgi:hypothetical protein